MMAFPSVLVALGLCVLCGLLVHLVEATTMYHSCAELYKSNPHRASAPYTIYNRHNQTFQVFCEFHDGYGYTFISPATNVPINIDDLHTASDHVLIRDLRTDNRQYGAKIRQITRYSNRPISIQYNHHAGYSGIINARMTPYIFVGLLPVGGIHHLHNVEGYQVNGHDVTFTNCDGNPNSYFAFLFNHNNHAGITPYNQPDTSLIHQWVNMAQLLPPGSYLPNNFYTFFEAHMGGCGGYGTTTQFTNMKGAAVGLRYDITCPTPQNLAHSTKVVSRTTVGGTVTYTCNAGYHLLTGSLHRTCARTGLWSGSAPACGQAACDSHPCYNGGSCFPEKPSPSFVCECAPGFSGNQCQTQT